MLSKDRKSPRRALLVIAMVSLTGCTTVLSDPATVCPAIVNYSPEFQARAAADLAALPAGSALGRMIIDYGRERDQLRECQ